MSLQLATRPEMEYDAIVVVVVEVVVVVVVVVVCTIGYILKLERTIGEMPSTVIGVS